MRHVQTALIAAVFAALCVIAWELHRINSFIQPAGAPSLGIAHVLDSPVETRAQRTERVRREARELEEDMKAILTDPATSRVPKRR